MASSNQSAKEYVNKARVHLVGQLRNLPLIVEKLHQKQVFHGNEVSVIEAEPEKYNKTRIIIDWVLSKGEEACYQFLRILDQERKSVLPNQDITGEVPSLLTWISSFSFRDEEDYTQGPSSCHVLQRILKTKAKKNLDDQWRQRTRCFGVKVQEKFKFTPPVLDTNTESNTPQNKITLKSKKSKKPRSKKMRAYIPKETDRKSPEDLLSCREKRILLVGKPGIGKTTVVEQMLCHWAERRDGNLDFVFYFDKSTLPTTSTIASLENLLLGPLLMSNPQIKEKAKEITEYLYDYSKKVTIIFDGITDFIDNPVLKGIMQHDVLPEAKIVATCRPEAEDDFFDWPTCTVYVQGFSEESIYDYFTQMPDHDPDLIDSVVNNPALFSLCHVPMYAFMVAACFSYSNHEETKKQWTASELYIRIFRHCLQRHGNKNLKHLDEYVTECKRYISPLTETAFSATKLKQINLEFKCDEKGVAGTYLRSLSVVSPAHARMCCAFFHNTMQEFFAALWLVENPQKLDDVLQLCQTEESKHMKHVIPFLCGLRSNASAPLIQCYLPLDQMKETRFEFFEKVLNKFLQDPPGGENDIDFLCQCLYELQSPEACCSFLERINYHLDFSEEHLDLNQCCAVSYVISQSRSNQVQLDLENSVVPLPGLKTILSHSSFLRDFSTTLCQVWTACLNQEPLNYLIALLQLCDNEIHIPVSSRTAVLKATGKIISQSAEQIKLFLHCDKDPQQREDYFLNQISLWLPHISSLHFIPNGWEKSCKSFKVDLFLQQRENIHTTLEKVIPNKQEEQQCDFLLDLYSHMKQDETETGRSLIPALLPVYQLPTVWSIKLSERKSSLLLEVLKVQTEKKPVELRDYSDEESEVRSFLQCLPYISQLRLDSKIPNTMDFLLNLFNQGAERERERGKKTLELLTSLCTYRSLPNGETNICNQCDFLLDLYSHMKQDETETGRSLIPALLPVYQLPTVWSIKLSERKSSLLLEVLKVQTEKKPVELRDYSDEESEVRSFLQCLPYISQLRLDSKIPNTMDFLLNIFNQGAERERERGKKTLELLTSLCTYRSLPNGGTNICNQCDFLLDLYSHMKQDETETGRSLIPALLPVYQLPTVWYIKLSERKSSLLLEVLKVQTEKKPVELIDCSDEESEVRSFLQCLPYISQLRLDLYSSGSLSFAAAARFLLNLSITAADCQSAEGESYTELLVSVWSYSTFPFDHEDYDYDIDTERSDFLLDLYSHMKQYETETGRSLIPALLPVYQLPTVWYIKLSERKSSLLLEVLKLQKEKKPVKLIDYSDEESEVRSFLQCLPHISHLRLDLYSSGSQSFAAAARFLLNLSITAADCQSAEGESYTELLVSVWSYSTFPFDHEDYDYDIDTERRDFLLDLCSHMKQYETETGRSLIPALLPVYQLPTVWSIKLSERKSSLLLEVLKLQTEKKPVKLIDYSDEESEVRSFLQCLPHISQLRLDLFSSGYPPFAAAVQFLLNLSITAADCQSAEGESYTELLASVCSYSTFPFDDNIHFVIIKDVQSDFLLYLYSRMKEHDTESLMKALLPVYQSPTFWSIKLSERKSSLLLEVLKLQTEKKIVELIDYSDEESEVRRFLQCLAYISQLRCEENLLPHLSKVVVAHTDQTELVKSLLSALDFRLIVDWTLTSHQCRAVGRVLRLSDSQIKLTLNPRAISLRGARLLFRHATHLQKLWLDDRLVRRMARAFQPLRTKVPLVIEELWLDCNSTLMSSLTSLLNLWTVRCLNLTKFKLKPQFLTGLMCHPVPLVIRLSNESLQQFADLLYDVQDGELVHFFLKKVGGDLTSCCFSWEELIFFLQQRVCCIHVNMRKSKISSTSVRQLLPLLSEVQFKRLNPSVVLSIIREIYETRSAHCVSSLLSSTQNCINLNNRVLDSHHCAALCFTLQNCTAISLNLIWTSIPQGELEKILPLLGRVSQLSVDRQLLLSLLHCCRMSELHQEVAAVLSALQNRLDFSCRTCLDLSAETQDNTLHLTLEDCRDVCMAILKSSKPTELILEDCEIEDAGVDVLFSVLHTVRLRCSKRLLLQFLILLNVEPEYECKTRAANLSKALDGQVDLSDTKLDLQACKSLALVLEYSEGLSELDLSHCQLTDQYLELLIPHLNKAAELDLSHNDIDESFLRIYSHHH